MAEIFQRVPWRSLKPNELRAEADRENQHADAAPARDQEMAELVEEDHDGQNEQERHDVADNPPPQRADIPTENRNPSSPRPRRDPRPAFPEAV